MTSPSKLCVLAGCAFFWLGCSVINEFEDPLIVGDWEPGANTAQGSRMEIDLDGDGTANFPGQGTFDLEWEQNDETGEEFDISFRAANFEATHECKVRDEGDKLRCTDSVGALFEWKKD